MQCSLDNLFKKHTRYPKRLLGILESLDMLFNDATMLDQEISQWMITQRRQLCESLSTPTDEYEKIIQHCIKQGGLRFMKTQSVFRVFYCVEC
jgi:hypothetical protein